MRKAALLMPVAALIALGGCGLGPKVPKSLYTLTATSAPPVGQAVSGEMANAIVVLEPEAEQRLDVTRVPVQVTASDVEYLKDAAWVERPARLMQRLIGETIKAKTGRLVLDDDATGTGTTIGGRLIDMGYDAQTSSVVVRFDAVRGGRGKTVTTRRFEAVVPGVQAKPGPVGAALNQAANDVAGQIADWVG